jgi:TolA-binding protein
MEAQGIFIIILLVCFAAQTYRLVMAQNESDYDFDLYEDHIDQLNSKIKELEDELEQESKINDDGR